MPEYEVQDVPLVIAVFDYQKIDLGF
jgi:hypothetical protein